MMRLNASALVQRCTFFCNFAGNYVGALYLLDIWPLVSTVEDTDFIHNDALAFQHEVYYWNAVVSANATHVSSQRVSLKPDSQRRSQVGPETRSGSTSVTNTGTHYDGGFTSEGIFVYQAATMFWITGTVDQPAAVWNCTWQQATWVDHAGLSMNAFQVAAYPALPDKQIELNLNFLESSIEDTVSVPGGLDDPYSGTYAVYGAPRGTFLTRGCRFARCVSDGSRGDGGLRIWLPIAGSSKPTMLFEGSEWIENAAGSGAAVFVDFGQVDVGFHRCLFRCVVALSSPINFITRLTAAVIACQRKRGPHVGWRHRCAGTTCINFDDCGECL